MLSLTEERVRKLLKLNEGTTITTYYSGKYQTSTNYYVIQEDGIYWRRNLNEDYIALNFKSTRNFLRIHAGLFVFPDT